jgi:hypothetical protein
MSQKSNSEGVCDSSRNCEQKKVKSTRALNLLKVPLQDKKLVDEKISFLKDEKLVDDQNDRHHYKDREAIVDVNNKKFDTAGMHF